MPTDWIDANDKLVVGQAAFVKNPSAGGLREIAGLRYRLQYGSEEWAESLPLKALPRLVELVVLAWNKDAVKTRDILILGLNGDIGSGFLPFLNRKTTDASARLEFMIQTFNVQPNPKALAQLLLSFELLEGILRPTMILAGYLLLVAREQANKPLLDYLVDAQGWLTGFEEAENLVQDALAPFKKANETKEFADELQKFLVSFKSAKPGDGDQQLPLRDLRNLIAHHDFEIRNGTVELGWLSNRRKKIFTPIGLLTPELLDQNRRALLGLASLLVGWEDSLVVLTQIETTRKISV